MGLWEHIKSAFERFFRGGENSDRLMPMVLLMRAGPPEAVDLVRIHPELLGQEPVESLRIVALFESDEVRRAQLDRVLRFLERSRVVGAEAAAAEWSQEREEYAQALYAFIHTDDPQALRKLLEAKPTLLSPETDTVLNHWVQRGVMDGNRAETRRKLLVRCREIGLDRALADLKDEPAQTMVQLLASFLTIREWDSSKKQFLLRNPALLEPSVDISLWSLAMTTDDEDALWFLGETRARLARCRRLGVEEAFAEKWRPGMMPHEPLSQEVRTPSILLGKERVEPSGLQVPDAGQSCDHSDEDIDPILDEAEDLLDSVDDEPLMGDSTSLFVIYVRASKITDPEKLIKLLEECPELVAFLKEWSSQLFMDIPIDCPAPPGLEVLDVALFLLEAGDESELSGRLPSWEMEMDRLGALGAVCEMAINQATNLANTQAPKWDTYYRAGKQVILARAGLKLAKLAARGETAVVEELVGEAVRAYREALKVYSEAEPLHRATILNELGLAYRSFPNLEDRLVGKAIECCEEALKHCSEGRSKRIYSLVHLSLGEASLALSEGNRDDHIAEAIDRFREVARVYRTNPNSLGTENHWLVEGRIGDCLAERGDWRQALGSYREAIQLGDTYKEFPLEEHKSQVMRRLGRLYSKSSLCLGKLGEGAEGLLTLERGKARRLYENLRLNVPFVTDVPEELRQSYARAVAKVREAEHALDHSGKAEDVSAFFDRLHALQEEAVARLERVTEVLRSHAPDFLRPLDLDSLRFLASDGETALVEFCIDDRGSLAFCAGPWAEPFVRVVDLPDFREDDLNRLLRPTEGTEGDRVCGWVEALILGKESTLKTNMDRVLAPIGKRLILPVVRSLPEAVRRLILVPTSGLFLIPLHAAPLAEEGSLRLCDRFEVSYTPSAQVLAHLRQDGGRGVDKASLYAAINPGGDPRLAFAPLEGQAVARAFDDRTIHWGAEGSRENVASALRGRSHLHFICHGAYDWEDVLDSGLSLANGRLTLQDLKEGTFDLSGVRLVTLSACESGLSDILKQSPEEFVGLPTGFLMAGVPCVVGSLWSVDDLPTSLLMGRFYANHIQGLETVARALQEAQSWLRQLTSAEAARLIDAYRLDGQVAGQARLLSPWRRYLATLDPSARPFAHPYDWAAFVVFGDGDTKSSPGNQANVIGAQRLSPGHPSNCQVLLETATPVVPTLRVVIRVQNLTYAKVVGIVFTTDNWATVQTAYGTYSLTMASGLEMWQVEATVGSATEVEFAIFYRAAGNEYWDNNFGRNYRVTPSHPRRSGDDS